MVIVEAPCSVAPCETSASAGAHDRRGVDAVVVVEALVLDRDRGVLGRSSGIWFQVTGVRRLSDWMKPRRVPSAARTSEGVPTTSGCTEASEGADSTTEITYRVAPTMPVTQTTASAPSVSISAWGAPTRFRPRRRFLACLDISCVTSLAGEQR